jgi:hypothetical protein
MRVEQVVVREQHRLAVQAKPDRDNERRMWIVVVVVAVLIGLVVLSDRAGARPVGPVAAQNSYALALLRRSLRTTASVSAAIIGIKSSHGQLVESVCGLSRLRRRRWKDW